MVIALLPDFDPPVRARVVADHGDTLALVYQHPEGWTCRTTRPRDAVQIVDTPSSFDTRAGQILDRLSGPDCYYLACAKADARALLLELDGTAPRTWAAMAARLEELR